MKKRAGKSANGVVDAATAPVAALLRATDGGKDQAGNRYHNFSLTPGFSVFEYHNFSFTPDLAVLDSHNFFLKPDLAVFEYLAVNDNTINPQSPS